MLIFPKLTLGGGSMGSGTEPIKTVFENLNFRDTFLIKARAVSYNNSKLVEAYRTEWGGFETGIEHLYWITTYKGVLRDWGVHKYTTDRYFAVYGEIEVALFEGRKQEPLFGQVSTIILSSDKGEGLLIPPGIYHTFRAISPVVILLNSKSPAYNEENPDKEKLPLKNDLIPLVWE